MKNLTMSMIIIFTMLMALGCLPQNQEIQQSTQKDQDAEEGRVDNPAEESNTDGSQAATDSDAQKSANNVDDKAASQNAQPQAELSDSELNQVMEQAQDLKELANKVEEIANWCRPGMNKRKGMTNRIGAQEWAKANNAFGFKFLRQMKGNTVFSPYSIERALGMTLDGACGKTASEMLSVLEMPNEARLSLSGRDVEDALKSVNDRTQIEIENSLWPDISMTLPEFYLARIGVGYRNKLIFLDYAADPEKARAIINGAIAHTTHDRITDVIPPDTITDRTKLILTNAVYFKSTWEEPFDEKNTRDEVFYNSDHSITTKMMHDSKELGMVCVGKDFAYYDLVFNSDLPGYRKGNYAMRIILPTVDASMNNRMEQLEVVEKLLLNNYTKKCTPSKFDYINISMPKFKLAPDAINLNHILQNMGIKMAFSDAAEFYAMPNTTPKPSDPSPYLKIDNVFHKAFIEIDEKGVEAAAATAVMLNLLGGPSPEPTIYHFKVDHPFLFMIIEQSTGAAVFMGRVTDL